MKKKTLFVLWGGLFALCAGLGFLPEPAGVLRGVLTALSVLFFLPPALLVWDSSQKKAVHTLKLVRNLSALSLILTLVLLVINFLLAVNSLFLGTVLYYVLVIVSSPMVCSGYWVLSLFLWACLLMVSIQELRRCK